MKKITMLQNAIGCDNGIHAREYEAGKEYDVSESLAHNFIVMNVAEYVEIKAFDAPDNKALSSDDYQNKSVSKRKAASKKEN